MPGAYAYSDAGNGIGYSYLSIRGFPQRRISVLVNGVPLNDPESHEVYWIDHPDLLASTAEVQVQRGVGSALYGAAALGGSVNLETVAVRRRRSSRARLGAGTFGTAALHARGGSGLLDGGWTLYGALLADRDRRLPRAVVVRALVVLRSRRGKRVGRPRAAPQPLRRARGDASRLPRRAARRTRRRRDRRRGPGPAVQPAHLRRRARPLLRAALRADPRLGSRPTRVAVATRCSTSTARATTTSSARARPARLRLSPTRSSPTSCAGGTRRTSRTAGCRGRAGRRGAPGRSRAGSTCATTRASTGASSWAATQPPGAPPNHAYYDYTGRLTSRASCARRGRRPRTCVVRGDLALIARSTGWSTTCSTASTSTRVRLRHAAPGRDVEAARRHRVYGSWSRGEAEPIFRELYDPENVGVPPGFATLDPATGTLYDPLIDPEQVDDFALGVRWANPGRGDARPLRHELQDEIVYNGRINDNGNPITGNAARSRHAGVEGSFTLGRRGGSSSARTSTSPTTASTSTSSTSTRRRRPTTRATGSRASRAGRGGGRRSASATARSTWRVDDAGRQYLDNTENSARTRPRTTTRPGRTARSSRGRR